MKILLNTEWRVNMDSLALIFVIIGALNWGLVSLFQFDLVASLFGGSDAFLSRLVYGLVALAGIYCIKFLVDRNRIIEK